MHNLQHSQVNQDEDTWVPKINQQGGTKPKSYILNAVGFYVISLMLNTTMLEICLESIQQTQLWQKR